MAFTDVLKKAYPFLAAAASAIPGGNIAASAIGQILNLKSGATLDDAGLALMNATPEQRVALQAEDNRHKEVMTQMGFSSAEEFEKIAAADRADAREREKVVKDKIPATLALLTTSGFFGVLAFMLFRSVPDSGHDALMLMLGSLGTAWAGIVTYYFGSSAGSAEKTRLMASGAATPQK